MTMDLFRDSHSDRAGLRSTQSALWYYNKYKL